MEIYPAIDLINGQCVRLSGGDYDMSTKYADDPLAVSQSFAKAGAQWLHVVDLDGAKNPAARQKKIIAQLAQSSLQVQTGGGVRSPADVEELLALGASRIIIGSLCVTSQDKVLSILDKHGPEKIVLAFDVRGDFNKGFFIATAGWQETSPLQIEEALQIYQGRVKHVLCTDISKDGKLTGPNAELYKFLCKQAPDVQFQASGGVAQLSDLDDLKTSGAAGVIIGKALYEKKFTLSEALEKAA